MTKNLAVPFFLKSSLFKYSSCYTPNKEFRHVKVEWYSKVKKCYRQKN